MVSSTDDTVRLQFETATAKFLVTQSDRLRGLENALRDESTAMLQQLQAQVCAQMDKTSQFPPENSVSGLDAMLKDLFERPEVLYGLVQWLDNKGDCKKAKVLVEELRVDIQTGEGNDARTTMNKLLPLYMKALRVREICGNKVPTASPGGKSSDKKLLGFLIQGCMRPFLEKLCTMFADVADNGDAYTADKSEDFREIAKRLKSALFVFMNIGNFASHTRGKLSFCQQVGLCGAVAAMAETLPLIFQACQAVKTGRATKLKGTTNLIKAHSTVESVAESCSTDVNGLEEKLPLMVKAVPLSESSEVPIPILEEDEIVTDGSVSFTPPCIDTTCSLQNVHAETQVVQSAREDSCMETLLQIDIVSYYKKYLSDGSSKSFEKYESTLTHMDMTPKARLCMQGTLCSSDDCVEAHSIVEALRFNPLAVVLKCPVPEAYRNDIVHKNKRCIFNHGEFKSGGTLRWGKKNLCWDLAGCTNAECYRSHSLAEVCWFNSSFRTEACPQGINCQWKQNCMAFHEEYYHTKRSADQNEFIGVAEPILFLERTLKVLQKAPVSSPEKSVSTKSGYSPLKMLMTSRPGCIKYYERKLQSVRMSDSERAKYTRVLNHMQVVAKARICMKGDQCKQDGGAKRCCESHDIAEALSFNPLAMTLTCPTPEDSRYDCIHTNELCLFYHGDTPVPKSFRDIKQLLCADLDNCVNDTCFKSHSVTEICWFFPRFRTKNCHHGDSCSQMKYCSLFHNEYHERRDILMNNVVGKTEPIKFVSRTLVELARFQGGSKQLQTHEREDDISSSCVSNGESKKLSRSSDMDYTAVDSDVPVLPSNKDEDDYIRQYEMALKKHTGDDFIKYFQVLTQMERVPKAKICIKIEHDTAADVKTCAESHTRMEALGYNPLAMILKCPIGDEVSDHRQYLCVFDHDGDIPKEFIKDKMLLCEAFDACDNANCVKSHSFAEVCWFNPQFRVRDCPHKSKCPCKENCTGFHPEHCIRRDARMNNQVGRGEMVVFVERTHAALMKRRNQAFSPTHPLLADKNEEGIQEPAGTKSSSGKDDDGVLPCKMS